MRKIYWGVLLILNFINVVAKIKWFYFVENTSMLIIYQPSMIDIVFCVLLSLIAIILIVRNIVINEVNQKYVLSVFTFIACLYPSIKGMF